MSLSGKECYIFPKLRVLDVKLNPARYYKLLVEVFISLLV